MDCETAQSLLSDLPGGSADRAHWLAAAAHADQCAECRQFVADADRIGTALRVPADESIDLPHGHYDALAERLAGAVRPARGDGSGAWRFAAAAAVALGLVGSYFAGRSAVPDRRLSTPAAYAAIDPAGYGLSPNEKRESAKAFTAVSAAFDHRADWVWTGDTAADVGLGVETAGPADRVVLVKLVLRRDAEVVSRGELAVVAGREAELRLPLTNGRQVRYRVGTTDPRATSIGVSAELHESARDERPLALLAAQVRPQNGRGVRLGGMSTTEGDFELLAGVAITDGAMP